jgi:hypothetical protein
MTAKKVQDPKWCETAVSIREDILAQARASGLDIAEVCNRALADATGIRYVPREPAAATPAAPVIIAQNGAPSAGDTIPVTVSPVGMHPVINADDPRSATTVKQVPRTPSPKTPSALPGRVSSPEKPPKAPAAMPAAPPLVPQMEKTMKPEARPEKKGKGMAIKKFVIEAIVREDTDETRVAKAEMYEHFVRWCREHRITPVPDRKSLTVALKNQFALKEKTVEGEPSWVNVRLK